MWWASTLLWQFRHCFYRFRQEQMIPNYYWRKMVRANIISYFHIVIKNEQIWKVLSIENLLSIHAGAKFFSQIPGPLHVPIIGSQWLYYWFGPYSLDKLHLANEGIFKSENTMFLCLILYIYKFSFRQIHQVWTHSQGTLFVEFSHYSSLWQKRHWRSFKVP